MKRRTQVFSPKEKIIVNKLDPGVFVVEIPKTGRKISLGQPPDTIKRLQQVGYYGVNAVDSFVLIDTKMQGDSICWVLSEFPILYALYLRPVEQNGQLIPAFFAGKFPVVAGLENDVKQTLKMIKYGNYGLDSIEEIDAMDIPGATKTALRKEILGLGVGCEIKDSETFIKPIILDPDPNHPSEFSDLGDSIFIGKIGFNQYQFIFENDSIEVDVTLQPTEQFSPAIEYKHLKFPQTNFGIWHTGEYDGMDPYFSCAHTSIIHKYNPVLIDYPSNITDIINHNGLSKQSINTIIVTHNHDDHIGGMVELFRRSSPCKIVTSEPVKYSVIKKIAALVDLPDNVVENSFEWIILPFLKKNPYQTETLNLDGLKITGHLSCHCVPTTVYTIAINHDGLEYTYAHIVDIVSFRRMRSMVKEGWMPAAHLKYLDQLIRKTEYNLLKYDAGCTNDESVPFSVHGQWQDLINSATDRSFRIFTHVNKSQLSTDYVKEGRFVRIGDLDNALKSPAGRLIEFGKGLNEHIPLFHQAYQIILKYYVSLISHPISKDNQAKMQHYAYSFANSPKPADLNIGYYLIEQGTISNFVYVIIKGRAEICIHNDAGETIFSSVIGDGEVIGDIGALSDNPRMASVKTLNRVSYLEIPSNLFKESMKAMNIDYIGHFKALFEKRLLFQSAWEISKDVPTIVFNEIAQKSIFRRIKKGDYLIQKGENKNSIIIFPGNAIFKAGRKQVKLKGPTLVGEHGSFGYQKSRLAERPYSVVADEAMTVLEVDNDFIKGVPVILDNIRLLMRKREKMLYHYLTPVKK